MKQGIPAAALDLAAATGTWFQRYQEPSAELRQPLVHKASAAPSAHGAECSRHVLRPVEPCGGRCGVQTGDIDRCEDQIASAAAEEPVASEQQVFLLDTACCLAVKQRGETPMMELLRLLSVQQLQWPYKTVS